MKDAKQIIELLHSSGFNQVTLDSDDDGMIFRDAWLNTVVLNTHIPDGGFVTTVLRYWDGFNQYEQKNIKTIKELKAAFIEAGKLHKGVKPFPILS